MIKYRSTQYKQVEALLKEAKTLAIQYRNLSGKSLGITAEVAEFEASQKLKCSICPARTAGHDLIDCEGLKVQVKGRVIPDNRSHRVPNILKNTLEKPWDYVVLVLFDDQYNVTGFYKADERTVEEELNKERPKGGQKRRDMPVSDFIAIATKI